MEYAATCVLTVGHDELGVGDDDDASLEYRFFCGIMWISVFVDPHVTWRAGPGSGIRISWGHDMCQEAL